MRFSLLGPLTVHDGRSGRPLDGPKVRILLGVLLLHPNNPVPTDRLQEALWGAHPPATAGASLKNHVARLRQALAEEGGDEPRIRTVPGGYVLRVGTGELDAQDFTAALREARAAYLRKDWATVSQQTEKALGLWRDSPLPELAGLAEVQPSIDQLQEARWQGLEWRMDAELALGRHQGLAPELTGLIAEQPLREAFHRQLMLVLHRTDHQAEALAVFRRLRRTLVDELGIEPGAGVMAAHQEILRPRAAADAAATDDNAADAAAPATDDNGDDDGDHTSTAAGAVGAGLPRDIAFFTGRRREIERLLTLCRVSTFDNAVVPIHAVDGMPGVGKSALAMHVAHQLAPDFPDGQIFLPLHAHTSGRSAVDPADALVTLLLAVGVAPQRIPSGLDARSGMWRAQVAGKRILLLLDDARSTDQVSPLLPGSLSTLVLVTSRRRLLALDGAMPMTLEVLPPDEAAELFVAKSERVELAAGSGSVTELVRLCGYLPLAIHLTAARLRHHRTWTTADLEADLEAAAGRLAALHTEHLSVAAAFDLSYRDLAPALQQFFRRLGLHPGGDIDAYAAAALNDTDLTTTRRLLEDLEDHHLIDEPVRGRYRMHDLIREHARSLATADMPDGSVAQDPALDRLLSYYLHTAHRANRHFTRHQSTSTGAGHNTAPSTRSPELSTEQQARAWFSAEQANLQACVEYAATHGCSDHAIGLPAALHEFLRTQGHWNQARALHQLALETACLTGDRRGQAGALVHLGVFRRLAGECAVAAENLHSALELYRTLGDRLGEANALITLASVEQLTGNHQGAAERALSALELYRALGDPLGQANALDHLGTSQQLTGKYQGAAENLHFALRLYREQGNLLGQANVLTNLAVVQRLTGQYAAALEGHHNALQLYACQGNRAGEVSSIAGIGLVQEATSDYAAATESYRRVLVLYRDMGVPVGEARTLAHLGNIQRLTGSYPAASDTLQQAVAMCRENADRRGEADALNMLGWLLAVSATPAEARACHTQALDIALVISSPLAQAHALEGIGASHAQEGHPDQGETWLEQARAIHRSLARSEDGEPAVHAGR